MEEDLNRVRIERPLYEQQQLRQEFFYEKPKKTLELCNNKDLTPKTCLTKLLPVLEWLPKYHWKSDLISDLIAGFTVAVMHIPQGMAYALLGNVEPIVGIYMAFFPVLIYFFFGTSKHNSMGTFAVVCLMVGKTVMEQTHSEEYTPMEVAVTVTFLAGLFHLIMFVLGLGAISALLSETLVSGFTTAAAIQVFSSQIKDLFGLSLPKHKGYFVVVQTWISIFDGISQVNYAALIISCLTIFLVAANNELLKPVLAKKTVFPVPIELLVVIMGTLASSYWNLEHDYGVSVLGNIPSGLPELSPPAFSLMPKVVLDALPIAIIAYTVTLSMALIFAQKLNYEVDANQELLAMGLGNIFGSFFSCMPVSASLSRSSIQQSVGGKSQLASMVSCSILLCILLWIGPLFEPLPKAVLASVIVVSLKGMLMQVTHLINFWRLSKLDALVWISTFLTVIFISIDIGLLVGIVMSLITIFILGFKPHTGLLGSVPHTDLYLDLKKYKGVKELEGIKIFYYCGGINFATKGMFKTDLLNYIGFNPQKEIILRQKLLKYDLNLITTQEKKIKVNNKLTKWQSQVNFDLKCLIWDFSSLTYVDPSGGALLVNLYETFQKLDIPVFISGCPDHAYEMMQKCLNNGRKMLFFSTVHDAVLCANNILNLMTTSSASTIPLN